MRHILPVIQERSLLKHIFSYLISRALTSYYPLSKTICAIQVEGIMRNISVKLLLILTSGSGGDVI